jgi:hypothetical protein
MIILTENAGFGGKRSAPRARPIYEEYSRRTRGLPALSVPAELTAVSSAASGMKSTRIEIRFVPDRCRYADIKPSLYSPILTGHLVVVAIMLVFLAYWRSRAQSQLAVSGSVMGLSLV